MAPVPTREDEYHRMEVIPKTKCLRSGGYSYIMMMNTGYYFHYSCRHIPTFFHTFLHITFHNTSSRSFHFSLLGNLTAKADSCCVFDLKVRHRDHNQSLLVHWKEYIKKLNSESWYLHCVQFESEAGSVYPRLVCTSKD